MLVISFIIYLGLLIILAKVLSRKMGNLSEFFLAGRELPGIAIALTFVAAWFGAGSTIGSMNESYAKGLSAIWLIAIPSFISCVLISLFFARRVRKLNILSQPEAIEKQYGPLGSLLMSWIILACSTTFIASQLVAAQSLLQMTMGLSSEVSIALILSAVVIYSIIGGFRAVVMTDIFQFFLFTTALLILFGYTLFASPITQTPVVLPNTFWDIFHHLPGNLAMMFTFVLAWSIAPEMWQRMASTQNPAQAEKAAMTAGLILAGLYALIITAGVLSVYHLPAGDPFVKQNVLVSLALTLPSPFLTMLVLIGVLSAITSTIDSSLNVGSLTFTQNILHRYVWTQASPKQLVLISRVSTALIGLPAAWIALYYQNLVQILWISADIFASTMFIPMMGVFYLPGSPRFSGVLAMIFGACPVILSFLHDLHLIVLPAWWPGWPYTTLLGVLLSLAGFCLGYRFSNQEGPVTRNIANEPISEEVLAIESP